MGAKWAWGKPQQLAFNELKNSLTSDCVMAHYNPEAETELRVDASPVGLGAILMQSDGQETRPVAYASRILTDVERRYSQTEREALAVVWGCEKFHLYLYGTTLKLFTDHKSLEFIYSPKGKPPPRIERWVLRLQPYRFKVVHMPGKTNPADVLSRLPISAQPTSERSVAEEYINFTPEKAVTKAMTLEQISNATQDDVVLQQVQQCLLHNYCGQTTLTFSDLPKCEMTCPQAKAWCFEELALSCLNACPTKPFPWLTKAAKALCALNNSYVRRCVGQESMLKQRPSSKHANPVSPPCRQLYPNRFVLQPCLPNHGSPFILSSVTPSLLEKAS
jgi:hypothetical protein